MKLFSSVVVGALLYVCTFEAGAVEARKYQLGDAGAIAPHARIELGTDSNPLRSTDGSEAAMYLQFAPTVQKLMIKKYINLKMI